MAEYVEEYLVALGYDLHSEEGQKYLQMCEDMERRHEELVKSGKNLTDQFQENAKAQQANITGDKAETEQLAKLDDMHRRLNKTLTEETRVKPAAPVSETSGKASAPKSAAPAPAEEAPPRKRKTKAPPPEATPPQKPITPPPPPKQPNKAPQNAPHSSESKDTSGDQKKRIEGDREEINLLGDMEKTVRQIGVAWNQLERGNIFGAFTQGFKGAKQFADMLDKAGNSAQTANKKSGNLKDIVSDIFKGNGKAPLKTASTGSEVAETVSAGGEAAGTGAEAGAAAAGAVVAGGIGALVLAFGEMAKEANKMASELAESAINIETMSRQLWITDSAAWQLNNTLSAMGKTTSDLNEIAINPTLNKQFKTLQEYQKTALQLPSDFQAVSDKWNQGVTTNNEELKMSLNYLKQMGGYYASKSWEPVVEGVIGKTKDAVNGLAELLKKWGDFSESVNEKLFPGLYKNSPSGTAANYAPQSSSYSNYEGAKVTYAPHIEVTANSDKSADIATAVSEATQQRFAESALIKNLQGLNR